MIRIYLTATVFGNYNASAGGFSLEKTEITALKDLEGVIKPGADDVANVRTRRSRQYMIIIG